MIQEGGIVDGDGCCEVDIYTKKDISLVSEIRLAITYGEANTDFTPR